MNRRKKNLFCSWRLFTELLLCVLWKLAVPLSLYLSLLSLALLFSDWCQYCSCESKISCVFDCTEFYKISFILSIIFKSLRCSFIYFCRRANVCCCLFLSLGSYLFCLSYFQFCFHFFSRAQFNHSNSIPTQLHSVFGNKSHFHFTSNIATEDTSKKKNKSVFFFHSILTCWKKKQNDHQMVHPTKQNIDIQPLELLFSSFLFNIEFCTRFSWISKRDWHLLHFCWNNNFLHTEYTRMHDQLMNDDDDDDCEKFCIYFLFHCHNSLASKTKSNAHTQSHTKSHTFIQQRHTFVIFYCCYCCCCWTQRRYYCKQWRRNMVQFHIQDL